MLVCLQVGMLAWPAGSERRYKMPKHEITQTCPICHGAAIQHVRCSNATCSFLVTTCPRCDREQMVSAFVADHEKDCVHGPAAFSVLRPATFVAPRRAA